MQPVRKGKEENWQKVWHKGPMPLKSSQMYRTTSLEWDVIGSFILWMPPTQTVFNSIWPLLFELQMICGCTNFHPCQKKINWTQSRVASSDASVSLNSGWWSFNSWSLRGPSHPFLSLLAPSLQLLFLYHPLNRVGKDLIDLWPRQHLLSYANQGILVILLRKQKSTGHPPLGRGTPCLQLTVLSLPCFFLSCSWYEQMVPGCHCLNP